MDILISALIQLFIMTLIPLLWWLITARKENFFKWIGLKKPIVCISKVKFVSIVLLAAVAYIVAMNLIMTTMMNGVETAASQFAGKGAAAIFGILIQSIIQTALSEEILFRGFLCKRLSNKFGFVAGNILQALCFGLLHGIPFGLVTQNVLVGILLVLLPGAIGFLQGYMNEKWAGGSIIPGFILHAVMNILTGLANAFL